MEMTRTTRRQLRLQSWTFLLLFLATIALIAWLSTRYTYEADWTANNRHTLAPATIELILRLEGAVTIDAYIRPDDVSGLRKRISDLIRLYQRHKSDIQLTFIDPDMHPDQVRAAGVTTEGELIIHWNGRQENLRTLGEQALTNALLRLSRSGERHLLFLTGHGERAVDGSADHDLDELSNRLRAKGLNVASHALSANPSIPPSTALVVIAAPERPYLEEEVAVIESYLEEGGNLLWLADPQADDRAAGDLATTFGITLGPGQLVDPTAQLLGIRNPAFIVVADYPDHPITTDLDALTLFPLAQAVRPRGEDLPWHATALLNTLPRAWSETGSLIGPIEFDSDSDIAGPLTLGLLLERRHGDEGNTQRIAIIGDADFVSNRYLGNGANQDLAERLINWLSHDDHLVTLPPRVNLDQQIEITPARAALLGFGFLFLLPLSLLAAGVTIWLRRRRR
jgi:ABC-type uncharacterized transport system involved in gliding motility auxiliary subunit